MKSSVFVPMAALALSCSAWANLAVAQYQSHAAGSASYATPASNPYGSYAPPQNNYPSTSAPSQYGHQYRQQNGQQNGQQYGQTPVNYGAPQRNSSGYRDPYSHSAPTVLTAADVGGPMEMQYGMSHEPIGAGVAPIDGMKGIDSYFAAPGGCSTCGPRCCQWLFSADVMALRRTPSNSYSLIEVPEVDVPGQNDWQQTVFDVSDINYDYEPGYRLFATYMCDASWGIELGYWSMANRWFFSDEFWGVLELQGPGWTVGSDPSDPTPVEFLVEARSRLHSGEINAVRGICDWMTLRTGVRFMKFVDELYVEEWTTPLYGLLETKTENEMVGGQLGADFKLFQLGSNFRLNATVNAAILYNRISHHTCSNFIGPDLYSRGNELALLGETGLIAKYRFGCHWALRAGYQVMALNGVALAPDQLATSDVAKGTSMLKTSTLFAHGGLLGVEFFW